MAPFKLREQQKRFVLGAAAGLLIQAGYEMKTEREKSEGGGFVRGFSSCTISFSSVYSMCFTFRL